MGVDLAQITFLGLTAQTWITVGISVLGFILSLLTFTRGWRWRKEADPIFVPLSGDNSLWPPLMYRSLGPCLEEPYVIGYIVNKGDGDAFDLTVCGHKCRAQIHICEYSEKGGVNGKPGWTDGIVERCPMLERDAMKQFVVITAPLGAQMRDNAILGIHWTASPTRLHRCRYKAIHLYKREDSWHRRHERHLLYRLVHWLDDRGCHHDYHHLDEWEIGQLDERVVQKNRK